jgi:hypothetical protein
MKDLEIVLFLCKQFYKNEIIFTERYENVIIPEQPSVECISLAITL